MSNGAWTVLDGDTKQTVQQAIRQLAAFGATAAQATDSFKALNVRLCGQLIQATTDVLSNSIEDSMIAEQKRKPNEFIQNNANYFWRKIQEQFEKRAGAASIALLEEAFNLSFDRESQENPRTFRSRFESLIHRINSIEGDEIKAGERISEQIKLAIVVRALPRSLNSTVQAVLSAHASPTIDQLFAALIRQHDSTATKASARSNAQSALSAIAQDADDDEPETLDEQSIAASMQHSNKQRNKGPRTRQPRSAKERQAALTSRRSEWSISAFWTRPAMVFLSPTISRKIRSSSLTKTLFSLTPLSLLMQLSTIRPWINSA